MRLTICEQATNNPDGTFTVIRGGLDHFPLEMPAQLNVIGLIEATPDEVPSGKQHAFTLSCSGCGADGELVGYAGGPPGVRVIRFVIPITLHLTSHGNVRLVAKISEHEADAELRIEPPAFA
jgi:hypothetical protein